MLALSSSQFDPSRHSTLALIGLLSKKILINHPSAQGYEKYVQSQMDHKLPRMILIRYCVMRAATSVLDGNSFSCVSVDAKNCGASALIRHKVRERESFPRLPERREPVQHAARLYSKGGLCTE